MAQAMSTHWQPVTVGRSVRLVTRREKNRDASLQFFFSRLISRVGPAEWTGPSGGAKPPDPARWARGDCPAVRPPALVPTFNYAGKTRIANPWPCYDLESQTTTNT